jgi:hypothetical protein
MLVQVLAERFLNFLANYLSIICPLRILSDLNGYYQHVRSFVRFLRPHSF